MAIFLSCYDLFRNIAIKCQAPLTFANNNGQIMKVKLLPSTIYRFDFYFILIRCALSRASNCVCKPTFYSSRYFYWYWLFQAFTSYNLPKNLSSLVVWALFCKILLSYGRLYWLPTLINNCYFPANLSLFVAPLAYFPQ